ncbi:MAG: Mth938-like domain-containing protein [Terriglobia bacterium]
MIEKYDFGRLQVDGKEYRRDVILYPEGAPGGPRVDASWWRKEGHRLDKTDLEEVVRAKPEVVVVGTGYYGCMKLPKETIEFLKSFGIELYAEPTQEACRKYNELLAQGESASGGKHARKVVAALHLTC